MCSEMCLQTASTIMMFVGQLKPAAQTWNYKCFMYFVMAVSQPAWGYLHEYLCIVIMHLCDIFSVLACSVHWESHDCYSHHAELLYFLFKKFKCKKKKKN